MAGICKSVAVTINMPKTAKPQVGFLRVKPHVAGTLRQRELAKHDPVLEIEQIDTNVIDVLAQALRNIDHLVELSGPFQKRSERRDVKRLRLPLSVVDARFMRAEP